jgi:hypothetical protein
MAHVVLQYTEHTGCNAHSRQCVEVIRLSYTATRLLNLSPLPSLQGEPGGSSVYSHSPVACSR